MTKVIGLTGGIGSGKTTVAKMFEQLNIPVYIADEEAKGLMNRSKVIKRKLLTLFGESAYIDNKLNRAYLASQIFNNQEMLAQMNAIVHPKVQSHFKGWLKKQNAPYIIYESAILFEHGGHNNCDMIITVTAPKKIRIERIKQRDRRKQEEIEAIMNNQWSDEKRLQHSDYVIENLDLKYTQKQVLEIHNKLLQTRH